MLLDVTALTARASTRPGYGFRDELDGAYTSCAEPNRRKKQKIKSASDPLQSESAPETVTERILSVAMAKARKWAASVPELNRLGEDSDLVTTFCHFILYLLQQGAYVERGKLEPFLASHWRQCLRRHMRHLRYDSDVYEQYRTADDLDEE